MRVADWPDTVTVTSRAPAAPAGVTAVIDVALATTTLVAGVPPIVTVAPAAKLVPVSVTAVPPAGYATEAQAHGHGPDPFAVVTTAVQAAGEIAQIGATLWGQAVRTAISRLPRP